jgi:hypothetical protein
MVTSVRSGTRKNGGLGRDFSNRITPKDIELMWKTAPFHGGTMCSASQDWKLSSVSTILGGTVSIP